METGEGVEDEGEEGDDDGEEEEESDVAVVRPVSVVAEAATAALCPVDGVERCSSLLLPRLFWEERDQVGLFL